MSVEIRIEYDQMQQVTTRFANQAQAIAEMLQQVRSSMQNLQNGGWIGRGANAFFTEMEEKVLPATERLQQRLMDGSRVSQTVTVTIRQAEEEAGALFTHTV